MGIPSVGPSSWIPPEIAHGDPRPLEERDERRVEERSRDGGARVIAERGNDRSARDRIGMGDEHEAQVRCVVQHATKGHRDALDPAAPRLTPMGGREDERMPPDELDQVSGDRRILRDDVVQRIDHRVADHVHVVRDAFAGQVLCRPGRRGEVPAGDDARRSPVHLLGERELEIVRAETRLDVGDRDVSMERGDGRRKRARGIALHDDRLRAVFVELLTDPADGAAQQVVERLARAHELQVLIEFDPEQVEHGIDELHVLARSDDDRRATRSRGIVGSPERA